MNGEIDKSVIPKTDPEQRKFSLSLINNKIVMEQSLGATSFEGNPIHKALLELYLIDKNLAVLTYNYHLSTLNYWASNTNEIKNIEDWLDEFEKLGFIRVIGPVYKKGVFDSGKFRYYGVSHIQDAFRLVKHSQKSYNEVEENYS